MYKVLLREQQILLPYWVKAHMKSLRNEKCSSETVNTKDFKCSSSQPVTEFLFGDNFPQVVKELNLTNKLGSRPINKHSYSRNIMLCWKQRILQTKLFIGRDQPNFKSRTLEAKAKIPETITQNKMVSFKSLLFCKINNFRGGQLEKHVRLWRKLTNKPNILSIISGDKSEIVDGPKIQHKA